ncbi:hypothetical protein MSG28_006310 [Choristoneura fumiferana]|nr:hypothetical protein MSG28_006310 [Choristoneura fumiferana]KAI8422493.1 hypothetical protein MSG28_006310 [Choristoneura fumiferana]
MGKTKRHSIDPEYIKKKIRKITKKIGTSRRNLDFTTTIYVARTHNTTTTTAPTTNATATANTTTSEYKQILNKGLQTEGNIEQIPEEFLAALGNEGEEKSKRRTNTK